MSFPSRPSAAARLLALAGLLLLSASSARADTIIKLGLGGDAAADIELTSGILSTVDDGDPRRTGDQTTNLEFLGFLTFLSDQADASFTLEGVGVAGAPTIVGGTLAVQNLTGGLFSLYDESNTLLLTAALTNSVLMGAVGSPATGAVFSTSLASLLPGGALNSFIVADSISFSISLTDIGGGAGLSVGGGGATLNNFTADATMSIAADEVPVPEPNAARLLGFGALLLGLLATRAQPRAARVRARGPSAARRR